MELTQIETEELVERIVSAVHPQRIIIFGSTAHEEAG